MPSRLVTFLLVPLLAVVVAACGSDAGQPASSSSDVSQLLRDTFANLSKLKSAELGMQLRLDSPSAQGPVSAQVSGPFASTGDGQLPRFAFSATLGAAGRSEQVGATWTGEKAFITLHNTAYAVSDLVARQFAAGYQQALRSNQAKQAKGGMLLSSLGIDFTKWLKDARNAGTAQVGDAQTVQIAGHADIPRMVDDLARISQRAQSLGVTGAQRQLTPQQKRQLEAAIKSVDVRIYTGAQDRILRRLVVHAVLRAPGAKGDSALDLDLKLTKVNQDQQISAPANPKPFSELLKVTGALNGGGLSGLLGVHPGGVNFGSGSVTAPTGSNVDRYAKCVKQASGDRAKLRKCAALLTG